MVTDPSLQSSTSSFVVYCLLIEHDNTVRGPIFPITCVCRESLGRLKDKIKDSKPNDLRNVDARYLTIYRCMDELDETDPKELQLLVNDAFKNGKCTCLSPRTTLDPAVTYVAQKPGLSHEPVPSPKYTAHTIANALVLSSLGWVTHLFSLQKRPYRLQRNGNVKARKMMMIFESAR